jgi:uracil-DNA glycosylase
VKIVYNNWKELIAEEVTQPYFKQLNLFLKEEVKQHTIYPKSDNMLNALKACPLDKVRVVILGMDPYINEGQAHGLSFSVLPGVTIPPSLHNIFKELKSDLGLEPSNSGCLIPWAKQGVLLLNSVLTVRKGQSGSHKGKGWEQFTDQVIASINQLPTPVAYILWGAYAKSKKSLLTNPNHLVLDGPHPSPLSAHTGFFGGKYFSKTNDFLIANNQNAIDWRLTNE